ncbi:MAG: hypothetical protein R3307_05280, partial [Anaerolineales bacterium]|nr:hypothetical protein [Anaerolineales bacterium]
MSCQLMSLVSSQIVPWLAAEGVDYQNAIVLQSQQPRTLDPALTLGGPDSPLGHIFNGLVTLDTDLQVQPDLAAGW